MRARRDVSSVLGGLVLLLGCTSTAPPEREAPMPPDFPVGPDRDTPRGVVQRAGPPAVDYWTGGLSRRDAIAIGRRQSPRLRAAARTLAVADAQIVTARTYPWNPVLDFDGGQNKWIDNEREWDAGVRLTQPIETGGQRWRREDLALAEREVTIAEVANEERLVRRDVGLAYAELVYRTQRLELARVSVTRAQNVLEVAERRLAAKDIADAEANLVRLEVKQASLELESASRETRTVRLKLLSLLGERERIFEARSELFVPLPDVPTAEALRIQALERRPDLQAAKLRAERADRRGDLARAERWPTIGLSLSYRTGADYIGNRHDVRDQDSFLGLGVSLPLPIFDRRQGPILEAAAEREAAVAGGDALRVEIVREVDTALTRLDLARTRVDVLDKDIVPLAERSLEQTREAYRLGKVGTLEVLRAQDEVQKARVSRLEALFEHDQALVELASVTVSALPDEER